MNDRITSITAASILLLSTCIWSGCSSQTQPASKDAGTADSHASGTVQSQASGTAEMRPSDTIVRKSQTPPSDKDIIKAIDDSGVMKRADGSLTIIPPVIVAHKGKQDKDGSWPVKVTFTLIATSKDGKTNAPVKTTSTFKVFETKDTAGKTIWKAQLGT